MKQLRGFSLLEVMLALVVVAIGIGVFLTTLSSHEREVAGQANGNDYSAVANEALQVFLDQVAVCNDPNTTSRCVSTLYVGPKETAKIYLNASQDKIGSADLNQIYVEVSAKRSDDLSLS